MSAAATDESTPPDIATTAFGRWGLRRPSPPAPPDPRATTAFCFFAEWWSDVICGHLTTTRADGVLVMPPCGPARRSPGAPPTPRSRPPLWRRGPTKSECLRLRGAAQDRWRATRVRDPAPPTG